MHLCLTSIGQPSNISKGFMLEFPIKLNINESKDHVFSDFMHCIFFVSFNFSYYFFLFLVLCLSLVAFKELGGVEC